MFIYVASIHSLSFQATLHNSYNSTEVVDDCLPIVINVKCVPDYSQQIGQTFAYFQASIWTREVCGKKNKALQQPEPQNAVKRQFLMSFLISQLENIT